MSNFYQAGVVHLRTIIQSFFFTAHCFTTFSAHKLVSLWSWCNLGLHKHCGGLDVSKERWTLCYLIVYLEWFKVECMWWIQRRETRLLAVWRKWDSMGFCEGEAERTFFFCCGTFSSQSSTYLIAIIELVRSA